MIKLTINRGDCRIKETSGNGVEIMSELCVIVKAVCTAFTEDEKEERDKLCSNMVLLISNALKFGEKVNWGVDREDDENADPEDDENADF